MFVLAARSGRQLTCSVHEVTFGLELRLAYGDDLMRSELFRGPDCDERIAERADSWRFALIEKGFRDIE
jgi:hypothetical protein